MCRNESATCSPKTGAISIERGNSTAASANARCREGCICPLSAVPAFALPSLWQWYSETTLARSATCTKFCPIGPSHRSAWSALKSGFKSCRLRQKTSHGGGSGESRKVWVNHGPSTKPPTCKRSFFRADRLADGPASFTAVRVSRIISWQGHR